MTLDDRHGWAEIQSPTAGGRVAHVGATLVVFAMFLAPLSSLQPVTPPPVITFSDLFFVAGFAMLAPTLARGRLDLPLRYSLGAGLLVVMALLSTAITQHPSVSLPAVLRLTYVAGILPLAMVLWRPTPRVVALLASAYVSGALLSLTYGLLAGPTAEGRYLGLSPHPNAFGESMAFAAALIPYLATTLTSRRWWWYGAGAACVYGIWISGSRASLVAFVMVAVAYVLLERSVRAAAALAYAGVLLAIAWGFLSSPGGNNAFARLLGAGSATDSDLQRFMRLHVAIDEIGRHPIVGNGFAQGRFAHDIYLQVGVAVGIFGLVGFLLMLSAFIHPLITRAGSIHLVAYPALLFVLVGPLTDILWDTLAWAAVSLSVVAWGGRGLRGPAHVEPAGVRRRGEIGP